MGALANTDNFAILQERQQQGASVVTLSSEEKTAMQGENWQVVVRLLINNVKIYGRVGWELGRLTAIKQYGIDPGPYPGLWKAVTGRF
jgi:hypothetical protein